jgi:glycerophosphoryl diester phosphodiesterase
MMVLSTMPLLIGHRGIPEFAPENSIIGAFVAKNMGIECIEVDAMLCRNNSAVIHHDFDLQRSLGINGDIRNFDYKTLKHLDISKQCKFKKICSFANIPTMKKMIDVCDKIKLFLNIEIKCQYDDLSTANTICKQILKHGNPKKIVVSSFNASILKIAKKIIPLYERNYIVNEIPTNWLTIMHDLDCTALIVSCKHNSFEQIKDLLKYHIPIYVFTVNDVKTYRKFNALNIGVFSDKPYTLNKYL